MKLFKIFVPTFMILTLLISLCEPIINTSESVSNKIFRLHILANSNSADDQSIKLKVRDYVIATTADIFDGESLEENIKIAEDYAGTLTNDINNYLHDNGYSYNASIDICKEYFKTRVYDDFTLPAGYYNSLKISIGKGEGHNWWCIIFPTVCIPACSKSMDEYLSEDEMELIEESYTPKFKLVEIYNELFKHLEY